MRKERFRIFRYALVILFLLALNRSAGAISVTFYHGGPYSIPAAGGTASPYPSGIEVTGITGLITDVDVTLYGITHTFPKDLDIVLVGPNGLLNVMLMSDIGSHAVSGINLAFDDSASAFLGSTLSTGTFKPTNGAGSDTFSSPAPAGPYGSLLSVFNGTDPLGIWNLFIFDDKSPGRHGGAGSILGWSLHLSYTEIPGGTTGGTTTGGGTSGSSTTGGTTTSATTSSSSTTGGSSTSTPVPEPSSLILLGAGLIGLARWGRLLTR